MGAGWRGRSWNATTSCCCCCCCSCCWDKVVCLWRCRSLNRDLFLLFLLILQHKCASTWCRKHVGLLLKESSSNIYVLFRTHHEKLTLMSEPNKMCVKFTSSCCFHLCCCCCSFSSFQKGEEIWWNTRSYAHSRTPTERERERERKREREERERERGGEKTPWVRSSICLFLSSVDKARKNLSWPNRERERD